MSTPAIALNAPLDPIFDAAPATAPAATASPAPAPKPAQPGPWRKFLSWALRVSAVTFLVAGVIAVGLMLLGWHLGNSDVGSMVVQVDGTTVHDAINHGAGATLAMWIVITLGLVFGFSAVLFGLSVAMLAVMFAFAVVGAVGLLMAAPAVLLIGLFAWVLRRAFGSKKVV